MCGSRPSANPSRSGTSAAAAARAADARPDGFQSITRRMDRGVAESIPATVEMGPPSAKSRHVVVAATVAPQDATVRADRGDRVGPTLLGVGGELVASSRAMLASRRKLISQRAEHGMPSRACDSNELPAEHRRGSAVIVTIDTKSAIVDVGGTYQALEPVVSTATTRQQLAQCLQKPGPESARRTTSA